MSDNIPHSPATVLCMGCATMDHIFRLDEMPKKPLKYRAKAFKAVGGGNAATAAVTIARLGGRAILIARLGDDTIGDAILRELNEQGVETQLVHRFAGCASLISSIFMDDAGERLIVSHFDPMISHVPDWLPEIPEGVGAMLADAHWPAGVLEMFRRAAVLGLPAILDADMPQCSAELIGAATFAAFSAPGLKAAVGISGIPEGLRAAARIGGGVMLATDGGNGVFYMEGDRILHQAAYRVKVVDTLGAGDVFHGALALAIAEGQVLEDAVAFANAAAAIKTTRFGGRAGVPTRAEVKEMLATERPMTKVVGI